MKYPVENPADWDKLAPTVRQRLVAFVDTVRGHRRARRYEQPKLAAVRIVDGAPAAREIVLICVTHNAKKHLPSLLAHYRGFGIRRFAFLDDRSDDGTQALLLAQPDVDLFTSDMDFRQSRGGLMWRDLLVEHYGRGRWYLSIDSDEYLIFPGCEGRPLTSFVNDLERYGLKRAHAPMIDIYPDGPLDRVAPNAVDAFPATASPLTTAIATGSATRSTGTTVRGGPRRRLFGVEMRMSKFPLTFMDRRARFTGGSHHGPLPFSRNFGAVHAVLLHHKFPPGAVEDFHAISRRGTHSGKSAFYKKIIEQPAFSGTLNLTYPGSRRYLDSQTLVDDGFMVDLRQS